jgi:transposase
MTAVKAGRAMEFSSPVASLAPSLALNAVVTFGGQLSTGSRRSRLEECPFLRDPGRRLLQCGIKTVAMESTGVYWIPLFQILEAREFEVCLVNARHVKNVPGRRTADVSDCQWLQFLHSVGLVRASYRPEQEVCAVRSLLRHRESLVQMAATHINHMQKALDQLRYQKGQEFKLRAKAKSMGFELIPLVQAG